MELPLVGFPMLVHCQMRAARGIKTEYPPVFGREKRNGAKLRERKTSE
jgi:hypothetical protein